MTGPLELEPLPDLESAREPWQALGERGGNLFGTWEWASTWWRHFGRGRPLRLAGCRRPDGTLAGVLPLYEARRWPLRLLRFVGHGPADQLGPACAPGDRPALGEALTRTVSAPSTVLLAERLWPPEGWIDRLEATVVRREESPRVALDASSWEDFLAARSSNFRQQVRRRERNLLRRGLVYRLADATSLDADLESLYRLHEVRWEAAGATSFIRHRTFHEEFAGLALERGWLRLWLAEIDDRPVAAWYGFRFADAYWYYQAGRDPAWDREAAGFVLLAHTIRQAVEEGMSEYKLLLGGEPYKARFASDDPGLETAVVGNRVLGRAAARIVSAAEGMSPSARGRLAAGARRVGLRT
jgi:CelD/BcsL family acetyltransferase involved in cellulose biosynthesis